MIDNLPNAMQPESLRVPNSGDYAILDVLCTHERNGELERRLESYLAELEQSKKRREEVMKMLRDYGNTMATSLTSQRNMVRFTNKYLSVAEECDAEVRSIEEKLRAEKTALEFLRHSRTPFRGVAQITLFTTKNTSAALTITYSKPRSYAPDFKADSSCTVVNNASWSPLYDLRATARKGKPSSNVHLHYRANLSQSTGEDWNDAQLTLSTRAPEDLDGGIPRASTIHIQGVNPERSVSSFVSATPTSCHADNLPCLISPGKESKRRKPIHTLRSRSRIYRPRPGVLSSDRGRSRTRSRTISISRSRSRDRSRVYERRVYRSRSPTPSLSPSPERRRSPVRQRFETRILRSRSPTRRRRQSVAPSEPPQYPYHPNETVITNDVTSVSYIMDGRCSIPGDGKLHKVTIAILPFSATIHHVITPRVSLDAYLQVSPLNFHLVLTVSLTSCSASAQSLMTATTPSFLVFSPHSWTTNMSPRPLYLKLDQGTPSAALSVSIPPSR